MRSDVSEYLQAEMERRGISEVTAVEAAQWLARAGILSDSATSPGLPLRNLLRERLVLGGVQRPRQRHGSWCVCRVAEAPERSHPNPDSTSGIARRRRAAAAAKYKPDVVDLLLVAEAPPSALDRYFYFENVQSHDSLFRYILRAVLGREPSRQTKHDALTELKERGVFLIDLREHPVNGTPLSAAVPNLLERIKVLAPRRIVLIKATVHDTAYWALSSTGFPVSPVRVPFPGSGQQARFMSAFAEALRSS